MITIFTPTYNRANTLLKLFHSLLAQTDYDFEWLIVDDCSSDNTKELVDSFEKSFFEIRYYRLNVNQGKHSAYNYAIDRFKGDYFICVDSDDYLSENAISIIKSSLRVHDYCAGYIFPMAFSKTKKYIKKWERLNGKPIDIIDTAAKYNISETAIVFKREFLKKYKFPDSCLNEKFCPETILYNQFISNGKIIAINKVFYHSEYLPDGLTMNIRDRYLSSPNNILMHFNSCFDAYKKYAFLRRAFLRSCLILDINAFCLKKSYKIMEKTPSKFLSVLLFLPSILYMVIKY